MKLTINIGEYVPPRLVALILLSCIAGLTAFGLSGAAKDGASDAQANALRPGEARLLAREAMLNALRAEGGGMPALEDGASRRTLAAVNDFFNRVSPRPLAVGREPDEAWATPEEFLSGKGGVAADFVVAKYFALRDIGIHPSRLRIFVVAKNGLHQPHFVLAYYPAPDADPLILDHLDRDVRPASARADLSPVYAFGADGREGDRIQHRKWREMTKRRQEADAVRAG